LFIELQKELQEEQYDILVDWYETQKEEQKWNQSNWIYQKVLTN
jgi:hypothetical protein